MAGSRIKGITIEIDGNTTGLQKALSGVNNDLRTTQSSLRDVNNLLKLDPTNTDLLRQKQDLLIRAIDDTKKKLETEKEALRQLKEADQTPEVVEQQAALERQIAADESALDGLKNEFSDFGSVGLQAFFAVGEQIKEVGKKITEVGGNITKHVTAPLAAIGGASIAAFKSVDDGYDTMIAKTGATGEAAQELRGIMNSLATEIPTDFETAGAAVGEVSTRFGVTGEALEDLSGKFIKFAELNGKDVSTSVDKVQKAMSAYGVDVSKAGDFLDRLNATAQETGVDVEKLTDGIVTNREAFHEMGLSVDQSVDFMGRLEKSGADSNAVLAGMRKALKNAAKEGKPMNAALAELQETVKNGNGSMDGLNAAYELFGKSGDQIYAAVRDGTLDFTNLGAAVSDAGGNLESTFAETVDPIDQFKTTLNELKIVGADVGATLLDVIAPAIEKGKEILETIKEKWEELDPETQDMIVKIGLVAAAIGPIIVILGTLVTAIGALMSPIGLVVAAVGLAIAAGVAIYKNWDEIVAWAKELKDRVVEAWETIRDKVVGFATDLKEKAEEKWTALKEKVSTTVTEIRDTVSEKWQSAKDTVVGFVETIESKLSEKWESIKTTASTVWEEVKDAITHPIQTAKETLDSIIGWIADLFPISIGNVFSNLKLPHFTWYWQDLGPISIPHVSVEWYKKAYETPYLFTTPTIIGGRGFGDGGGSGEIVYGRDQLMRDIAAASSGEITINVYASEGMDINRLAERISDRLALVQRQRARAYA